MPGHNPVGALTESLGNLICNVPVKIFGFTLRVVFKGCHGFVLLVSVVMC